MPTKLASHVPPDLVATVDSYADFQLTWEQLRGMWRLMLDLDPAGSCFDDVKSISSDVDDRLGRAAVYAEIAASRARGADGKDVTRHAMCELKWGSD
ncbi:hypothetical protein AC578_4453 [Pseudocercospora eumusae]|uniref:Uncharacterized protein n=1 Tax=Pseudocercospora eumusae TaxID=321146 RepID=A0A139HEY1_9PEZI|nr:hypothetical protein AC578_4453 [Pseudocercospora eumusae]